MFFASRTSGEHEAGAPERPVQGGQGAGGRRPGLLWHPLRQAPRGGAEARPTAACGGVGGYQERHQATVHVRSWWTQGSFDQHRSRQPNDIMC